MVAADEMGHKGVRAMTPLDTTLANALRAKLGKGRELPEEPVKAKRVAKPKVTVDGETPKKPAVRVKKTKVEEAEGSPVELRPAATIVKPKPAPPAEVAPEPPAIMKPAAEIAPEPSPVAPAPPPVPMDPIKPAAAAPAPPATGAPPRKPEPKIVPFRPIERPAQPSGPSRPSRQPAGPFAPPRVTVGPPRPMGPPMPARPAAPPIAPAATTQAPAAPPARTAAEPPRRPAAAEVTAAEVLTAPPAEIRREVVRVPESVTVAELAEKMRRKSGEVIKALLELGVMATVNELLDATAAKLVADKFHVDLEIRSVEGD